MPKRLADFTIDDWLRLRPLTQHIKTMRYDANNALHMRKPVRTGDIAAVIRSLTERYDQCFKEFGQIFVTTRGTRG